MEIVPQMTSHEAIVMKRKSSANTTVANVWV
jgi:hypothetical protein